jgi:predicted enzyme related to lactoylglutathione lyase
MTQHSCAGAPGFSIPSSWRWASVATMITGIHAVIFNGEADATRAFFRDALGFPFVDAGGGWLIFALPPAEIAAHPTDEEPHHELYLMCDDVHGEASELKAKGVELTQPITEESFGLVTALALPGGSELGLYQPTHPSPLLSGR